MKYSSRRISVRSFLTIGPYEEEEEFSEVLKLLSQRGMFIAGLLGSITVIVYILAHLTINTRAIAWSYVDMDPQRDMVLYDKGLVLGLCVGTMLIASPKMSLFTDRLIIGFTVWAISLAMLMDDILGGDISVSPIYISFALILAVGALPYKGWHTALLNFSVIITTIGVSYLVPALTGWFIGQLPQSQTIYLVMLAIVLTGMSSQLYLNRYEQYREWHRAEKLSRQLEERAKTLQKLKEKSEAQARQLMENEKLKDRFFTNISHEFRTPLTVLMGPLKDMLKEAPEERKPLGSQLLNMMYSNGCRLLDLINQLLDLAKFDAGQIRLAHQNVNLVELVRGTTQLFIPLAESRGITLDMQLDLDPVPARVDPRQLERALGNLISNAIKFTGKNGEVRISLSVRHSEVSITVRDNGIGIPAEELPYVFDRFYQAAQAGDRRSPGTGIGLALALEIVKMHSGVIKVDSWQGEGSLFEIHLPGVLLNDGDVALKPVKHANKGMAGAGFLRAAEKGEQREEAHEEMPVVVLVDDNPDILAYLCPQLAERYRVHAFEKSREALEIIKTDSVDLLISDVRMPDPDGFELCRIIKESDQLNHIPVILLTAQASGERRLEGLELGADDYINKPFSASELLVRIENLIEVRRTLREKYSGQIRLKGRKITVSSDDARFLKQVQQVIERHINDSNFGVEWLAGEVNFSPRQLQRKLRTITQLSAGGYIRMMRLERASQLLEQEWGSISEIAYKVGFQDPKYFSRLFKQTFGATPTEYTGQEKQD